MEPVARAAEFFARHGRDIDKQRFGYHFAGGSQADVIEALSGYQNRDGGFGHGLEVDITAPDSNPFATELALMISLQADIPRDHPVLSNAVGYLEETQDSDGGWRFSAAIYAHQLAPWFRGWQWPSLNPACAIAGLLRELGLGSETLRRRVEGLFRELAQPQDLLGDDYYAVKPYAYYFLPEWDHPQRELYISGVMWWLIRQHAEQKLADAGHFFDYVRAPGSFTGRCLPRSVVCEELDRLAAEQADDGGWPTPYDQGWRVWTTVQNLLVLQQFGRL